VGKTVKSPVKKKATRKKVKQQIKKLLAPHVNPEQLKALVESLPPALEAGAAAVNAELQAVGFDPASIIVLVQVLATLFSACKKEEKVPDAKTSRVYMMQAVYGGGNPLRSIRIRAAAKRSMPKELRSAKAVNALLLAGVKASEASFVEVYNAATAAADRVFMEV